MATTVPELCGSLKAYKDAVKTISKRAKPDDGLGLYRAGMNLHFFRTGIKPTCAPPLISSIPPADPPSPCTDGRTRTTRRCASSLLPSETLLTSVSLQGGRITISPNANIFDYVYERLVLLLAGASLEIQAAELPQGEGAAAEGKSKQLGLINGVVASRRAVRSLLFDFSLPPVLTLLPLRRGVTVSSCGSVARRRRSLPRESGSPVSSRSSLSNSSFRNSPTRSTSGISERRFRGSRRRAEMGHTFAYLPCLSLRRCAIRQILLCALINENLELRGLPRSEFAVQCQKPNFAYSLETEPPSLLLSPSTHST